MSLKHLKVSKRMINPKSIISASIEEMAALLVGLQEKQVEPPVCLQKKKKLQKDLADDGVAKFRRIENGKCCTGRGENGF